MLHPGKEAQPKSVWHVRSPSNLLSLVLALLKAPRRSIFVSTQHGCCLQSHRAHDGEHRWELCCRQPSSRCLCPMPGDTLHAAQQSPPKDTADIWELAVNRNSPRQAKHVCSLLQHAVSLHPPSPRQPLSSWQAMLSLLVRAKEPEGLSPDPA